MQDLTTPFATTQRWHLLLDLPGSWTAPGQAGAAAGMITFSFSLLALPLWRGSSPVSAPWRVWTGPDPTGEKKESEEKQVNYRRQSWANIKKKKKHKSRTKWQDNNTDNEQVAAIKQAINLEFEDLNTLLMISLGRFWRLCVLCACGSTSKTAETNYLWFIPPWRAEQQIIFLHCSHAELACVLQTVKKDNYIPFAKTKPETEGQLS